MVNKVQENLSLRHYAILYVIGRAGAPLPVRGMMEKVNALWEEYELDKLTPYRMTSPLQISRGLKRLVGLDLLTIDADRKYHLSETHGVLLYDKLQKIEPARWE